MGEIGTLHPLPAPHQQVLQRSVKKKVSGNVRQCNAPCLKTPLFLSALAQVAAMACFWPFLACLGPLSSAQAAPLERDAGPESH